MKLFTALAAAALFAVSEPMDPPVAQADSTNAFCTVASHDHTIPVKQGPCRFSQYQGTIHILMEGKPYTFLSSEQGKTYTRKNMTEGIWLNREGDVTVAVLWQDPGSQPGGY